MKFWSGFSNRARVSRFALWTGLALGLSVGISACAMTPGQVRSDLSTRLADGDRPADDKERDAGRNPGAVIAFFGVQEGMTVVDLLAAGGYYSDVLAEAVGPNGKVYAHNIEFLLKMRDGVNDKQMTARLAGGRRPNIERLDREIDDLGLAAESIDFAMSALNFHDLYGRGKPAADGFLNAVRKILKPGAVLGIIDHAGNAGADNNALHRIQESIVIETVEEAGFRLDARSEVLRNPLDDRAKFVFADDIRGKTDRFVLRFVKTDEL